MTFYELLGMLGIFVLFGGAIAVGLTVEIGESEQDPEPLPETTEVRLPR